LGERIVAVLKQKNNAPVPVEHQVCILYGVINGYLKDVPVERIPEFEQRLQEFMNERYYEVLTTIRQTGKMDPETQENLKKAITELLETFVVNY
jgi:F-type H+-transporting ATPase subunit alpha